MLLVNRRENSNNSWGFGAICLFFLAVATPALGQTITYADCAALDGEQLGYSGGIGTINNTIIITSLEDTDLVTLLVTIDGRAAGVADVTVTDPSGTTLINNQTFSGITNETFTYDPSGNMTNASYNMTANPMSNDDSINYTFACASNGGNVTAATTQKAFLRERANLLIDSEPNRPRIIRKLLSPLWGGDNSDIEESTEVSTLVRSPASQVSNFHASQNGIKASLNLRDFAYYNKGSKDPKLVDSEGSCWDVWGEAQYTRYADAGSRTGDFTIGYLGIDCQIHASAITGVLVQVDWMDDNIGSANSATNGTGWMVGPYATVQLTPNLFFDARAAWGRSENDVNVAGITGNFDTERWLVSARFAGNFILGDYRITPEVSLSYIEERQDSFLNSAGISVPTITSSLGRFKFGPEIAKPIVTSSGDYIEPFVSLNGIWDFDSTNVTVAGTSYSNNLRGIVRAGVIFRKTNGINFRVAAKYNGLGAGSYSAYGGEFLLNFPF